MKAIMLKLTNKIYTGLPRSDVEFEVMYKFGYIFIILYDLDLGGRSITNDIDAVVGDLKNIFSGLEHANIFYRDSDGCFDEIIINKDNSISFRALVALDLDEAFDIWITKKQIKR